MGQHGRAGRVHAHDEQGDEDHPEAGEEEQAASGPVVRQSRQDLRSRAYLSDAAGGPADGASPGSHKEESAINKSPPTLFKFLLLISLSPSISAKY